MDFFRDEFHQAYSLRNVDPFVRRSFIREAIIPAKKSYINRIADTRSGLTYAPISDELEPFEESMCWKVCKMRWDEMSNEARAKTLKSLPDEHPTFNYFFARSAEHLSAESGNVLGSLPVFRSIIEIEIPRDTIKMTGDDQKTLAGVLDTFRIGRGESLFKKKAMILDGKSRKFQLQHREKLSCIIDTMGFIPLYRIRRPEVQIAWERESTISKGQSRSVVPSESVNGRSTIPSRMDDIDSETDLGGFNVTFDNDANMDAEMASSHMNDFPSVVDDVRLLASKQTELSERPESIRVESSIGTERMDAASAYGDLHFVDERRVAIMAYSIVNDETHWKKRKLDKENIGAAKGKPLMKLDKVERKKDTCNATNNLGVASDEEKEVFEIGDFDNMPLAVIRDRQRQTKRPTVLVKREDEVLKVHRTRVAADLFYKPEQFCRLAHGEWENVRFNRAMSAPVDVKDERMSRMLRQNIREDLDPEEAIKEHMSCFNSYFDDVYSEQRSMSVPCTNEAFNDRNDNDLFSEIATQDNDDNDSALVPAYDVPTLKPPKVSILKLILEQKKLRQRRINAPAVKRAISTILSNAKFLDGLNDLSIVSEDSWQDSLVLNGNCIELSTEEERLQLREEEEMHDDPTCELRHAEVTVKNFRLAGRHTFSSVLAQLPLYLAGRTADDLSPINAFSVLLHLCNENNLELLQRRDDHGLIMSTEMGDFTIISARQNRLNRKRTASECR
ncbi:hypothetical protein DINM_003509 [Dirofilaria immitis]|nr:hypothetical protein [Dirofilaria immitis]